MNYLVFTPFSAYMIFLVTIKYVSELYFWESSYYF
jgi:hypothetical protein